jgi:Fe-Mn family superoxide dismutase
MMNKKLYELPPLPYGYADLAPFLSEEQLKIHHDKHHQKYVDEANKILEKLDNAHEQDSSLEVKNLAKELSFNLGGHVLHSLFWANMAPVGKMYDAPSSQLGDVLVEEFGSMDQFKKEFSEAAITCEGSGWAVLSFCQQTERPLIFQIEKHNLNIAPGYTPLLVLDVWEHAYYLDYKSERKKYVEGFWDVVNWDVVSARFDDLEV